MAEDLYTKSVEEDKKAKGKGGSKKIYALVLIIVALAAALGYVLYSGGLGGILPAAKITSANDAANALSGLGNDVNNISEGLKDINSKL
jgi:flagellar basal body-associated protein FliL